MAAHKRPDLPCLYGGAVVFYDVRPSASLGERTLDTGLLLKKRLPRLIIPLAGWTVVALLWKAVTTQASERMQKQVLPHERRACFLF